MKAFVISLFAVFTCVSLALGSDLGGYTFLKISGSDARAVVETPDGVKKLVAPGEVLGEATITEIAADRVLLEQPDQNGTALLIVKVKNGRQQISRLQQMPVQHNAPKAGVEKGSMEFNH